MTEDTTRARRLLDTLGGKKRILIVMHDNPDPDAIGASMALAALVLVRLGRRATLAFGGIIGRAENKALVDALGVDLKPTAEIRFSRYDAIALVDTQPAAGNNSLPDDLLPLAVFDHHYPRQSQTDRVPFVDLRPDYGACSTILVEYLRALGIPIDARLATALFYGIKVDTQDLGRHATPADIDAYMHLFPMADKLLLPRIEYPPLPREYFETFRAALERAQVYGKVVLSALDEVENPNAVAEVADLLLRLEGTVWALSLGFFRNHLFVSVRSADPEANAHEVLRRALGSLGPCGGHGLLAGGRVTLVGRSLRERNRLRDQVAWHLLGVLGVADLVHVPLLRSKVQRRTPATAVTDLERALGG